MAAGAVGGVGLQHDIPVHAGGVGLCVQRGQQQGIEIHPLQRRGRRRRSAEAAQQLGFCPAGYARGNAEHQHAALFQAADEALFDGGGLQQGVVARDLGG